MGCMCKRRAACLCAQKRLSTGRAPAEIHAWQSCWYYRHECTKRGVQLSLRSLVYARTSSRGGSQLLTVPNNSLRRARALGVAAPTRPRHVCSTLRALPQTLKDLAVVILSVAKPVVLRKLPPLDPHACFPLLVRYELSSVGYGRERDKRLL